MLHSPVNMSIWPVQTILFFKVGVGILPVVVGMYAAEGIAHRRGMKGVAKLWSAAGGICLAAVAMCLLAAVLVWAMA